MKRKHLLTLSLLILTYGGFGQSTLTLVLEKGKKYELNTVTKINTTTTAMGQDMESVVSNESTEWIEVKDTRPNEIDIASTLKNLNTSMNAMGQDMSYNSADKNSSGPLADQLGKTIDKTKNYTVDLTGNILKSDKANDDEAAGSMALTAVAKASGLGFINKAVLGKTLKAGDSWPDTTTTSESKMNTKIIGTYKVKSIDGTLASLGFSGIQSMTGSMEQMGMEMTISGNNKIETDIILDMTNGVITSIKTTVDMVTTIEASGMSIPSTGKTTITQTLKAL
jgi:hypothetical protein